MPRSRFRTARVDTSELHPTIEHVLCALPTPPHNRTKRTVHASDRLSRDALDGQQNMFYGRREPSRGRGSSSGSHDTRSKLQQQVAGKSFEPSGGDNEQQLQAMAEEVLGAVPPTGDLRARATGVVAAEPRATWRRRVQGWA